MYETALIILKKLNDLGYDAYIIGGYPRNKYLNIKNDEEDIDICTSALENIITNNFKIIKNNHKYGSYNISVNNYNYEITTFRKDSYSDSRYPIITYTSKIEEDLLRRDFTINTLCIDYTGNYYNLFDVINDFNNKIIRTVKKPEISLKEDPLRILRAIRFSADLNFNLEKELYDKIKENGHLLDRLSKNLIKKEINKVKNINQYNILIDNLDLKKYLS
ncbi:MAG: hypothetical protein PHN42_03045 [Bacilli bacterium]|nr:hypothetical protein [Bacilli bacterium]